MTQLCGAGAVLVGTIAFALLLDQLDAIYVIILSAWAGAGMAALISGGWAVRPSPTNLVICASIDAAFCGVLLAVAARLPLWLRAMPPADVEQASLVVSTLAVSSGLTCLFCLVATPAALRYWRDSERARPADAEPLTPANTAPGFPPPVTTGAFLAGGFEEPPPARPPQAAPALTFAPAVARSSNQSAAFAAPHPSSGLQPQPSSGPQPWALPVQRSPHPAAAPSWPAHPAPGYAPTPSAYAARTPTGSPLPLPPGFDGTPPPYVELGSPPGGASPHAPAAAATPSPHAASLAGFSPSPYAPSPYAAPAGLTSSPYAPASPAAGHSPAPYAPSPYAPAPAPYAPPPSPYASPPHTPPPSPLAPSGVAAPARPAAPRPARRGVLVLAIGLTVGCAAALAVALVAGDRGDSTPASPANSPATKTTTSSLPTTKTTTAAPATVPDAPATAPATVEDLLEELHRAIARADEKAVQRLLWPKAFAFSVRATGRNDSAEAAASALARDLGVPPAAGFTVEPRGTAIGQEGTSAWIAEELSVRGAGQERTFAVSMLATTTGGTWKIVAWHWAVRLPDEEVERRLEEGELPIPESFDDRLEAPAEAVETFREAFSSPAAFALTVSSRPTAFNFGSAPRERLVGGDSIRRVFRKLSVELALGEGVMVVSSGAWDEAQRAAPQVAWAAANVEFVAKRSRRHLRVLAVMVREGEEWRIVQTQWSDGL